MTLVSIIGDFHSSILPICYEFRAEIETHIIVYDDDKCDTESAERIMRGQRAFLKTDAQAQYRLLEMRIDEDSYESMVGCLDRIGEIAGGFGEVYLNSTDGLSSVALVFASKLLHADGHVLAYDRYTNTYNLHTCDSITHHKITQNMDIATHLQLKGYTVLDYSDPAEMAGRKSQVYALCENIKGFKTFTSQLQHTPIGEIEGYDSYKNQLKKMGKYKETTFIQGTVFEEYIYHLISDNLDFDDVMTGVLIEVEEGLQNELDILMIRDNHLHTIECKLVNGLDGEHFVYKTDLVMEYLDDDGKAIILSIGAPNERRLKSGKKKVQFSKGDKARANYGRINIYQEELLDEEMFLEAVRGWFLG